MIFTAGLVDGQQLANIQAAPTESSPPPVDKWQSALSAAKEVRPSYFHKYGGAYTRSAAAVPDAGRNSANPSEVGIIAVRAEPPPPSVTAKLAIQELRKLIDLMGWGPGRWT
jgi:hypothetical protein